MLTDRKNNWNPGFQPVFPNYPTPPSSGGLGPRRGSPSYSPGDQSPVAARGPVDGQYAVTGSQNIVDHQYPFPDQNTAVEPLQYEININNYMLNSPGFLQYPGDEPQMHGQESQLLVGTLLSTNQKFCSHATGRQQLWPKFGWSNNPRRCLRSPSCKCHHVFEKLASH